MSDPSHVANLSRLGAEDPVVLGGTRAIRRFDHDEATHNTAVGVLLHGDATFAGQGVVYETPGISELPNYSAGGTIHPIVNTRSALPLVPSYEHCNNRMVGTDDTEDSSSGDVKCHLGANYVRPTPSGKRVSLSLVANPSHPEAEDPVVLGRTRALQHFDHDETAHTTTMGVLHIAGLAATSHSDNTPGTLDRSATPQDDPSNPPTNHLPPTLGPSLHTHRALTTRRNFDRVNFGYWHTKTWYFSPYPSFGDDAETHTSPCQARGPRLRMLGVAPAGAGARSTTGMAGRLHGWYSV
ncbi:2-oxoglutarate dehydrogenase E1 component [Ceratobasidium sp. 370]|nr:2-oxoglutarate dehydrogenase E1 component [Ceratobasidium sp. 370]